MTRRILSRTLPGVPAVASVAYWLWLIRLFAGLLNCAALVFILRHAIATIDRAHAALGASLSAPQVTQVYAEHLLYALVSIGIAVGLYIATRMDG